MTLPGFDRPEEAAMAGFPQHCRVVASRAEGVDAYVLLNTGTAQRPYLYGVNCLREHGRWLEGSSSNACGWSHAGPDPLLGTLSLWDDAPAGSDRVRIEFGGRVFEELVTDGVYLAVWWRMPQPSEWPREVAIRIAGTWIPRPDGYGSRST